MEDKEYWYNKGNSDVVMIVTKKCYRHKDKKKVRLIKYIIVASTIGADQPFYLCPAKDWHKYFVKSATAKVLYGNQK